MPAGSITDDTEQAVLVADLLIGGSGTIDPMVFAKALLDWEAGMVARGLADLLGPSTKRALKLLGRIDITSETAYYYVVLAGLGLALTAYSATTLL